MLFVLESKKVKGNTNYFVALSFGWDIWRMFVINTDTYHVSVKMPFTSFCSLYKTYVPTFWYSYCIVCEIVYPVALSC